MKPLSNKKIKIKQGKPKATKFTTQAVVVETLPSRIVRVRLLEGTQQEILVYRAGAMCANRIGLVAGDRVDVEMDVNAITSKVKGRIIFRHRD